ncbi:MULTISPECIES: hypothetical protein [Streptomyces]|nr:hypothetical protein [Streptomyces sp. NEAU-HV9]
MCRSDSYRTLTKYPAILHGQMEEVPMADAMAELPDATAASQT